MTTSTTAPSPEPLTRGWLKGGLLAVFIVGTCWGGAIWYWRATDHAPATLDLVLYLAALPLALVLALGFARRPFAKPAAAAATAVQTQPAATPAAPKQLAIVATAVRLPHCESIEKLSAVLLDNQALAELDQELVDEKGFPVMTARSGDATDEALQEEITDWLTNNGMPELRFSDEQWRAVTMASAVAGELASYAASDLIPQEGTPPMLQLVPILPPEWHIDQRRAVGMWLKHAVAQFGWPPAYIALAQEKENEASPTAILGRLGNDGEVPGVPLAALVVACASHLSEETVGKWEANAILFTSSHPHGLIPGEGAAGLLMTDLRQARSIEDAVFALLDPVCEGRRETSADDSRRADPKVLGELAELSLKRATVESSNVAMIIADTGHRSNRVLELMGLASTAMPQLDGAGDVVRVGAASGTCGAVPLITAIALARYHALERHAPVLCVSNEDSYLCGTALVRPATSIT